MKLLKITFIIASLFCIACESLLIGEDPVDSPETNFEMLWQEFDRWYAGFIVRNIDWDSLYTVYRPQVTPQTPSAELWNVVTEMLNHLDDLHTEVEDPDKGLVFNAYLKPPYPFEFDLDLIKENYLNNRYQFAGEDRLLYGQLADQIGYIYIFSFEGKTSGFNPPEWTDDINQIISQFENLEGLIIDLRQGYGGKDAAARRIAGAFADTKRLVFTVQTRNGPKHDDFDEPTKWYVEPQGPHQFTKPIVLITDYLTPSAAEAFSLFMVSLPHVTHIGDSTAGAFSAQSNDRYLPNGWVYRMSHQLTKTPDGRSPEGIGVVPDILISNTEADIRAGTDKVLEFAIDYLN
ncbi:MAG: S41 family peptidase [Waddliaceae bacterium]